MEQPTASTSGTRDRHTLSSPRATDVAERHDSGRSAVVSLLGDRSPAVLNHLDHRWIIPDLLGSLVGLLVPGGNQTHHPDVISGQPRHHCSSPSAPHGIGSGSGLGAASLGVRVSSADRSQDLFEAVQDEQVPFARAVVHARPKDRFRLEATV